MAKSTFQETFHGMLDWSAGGAAAASFALFVYVPSLENADQQYQTYATHLFLAAMPFLVSASGLSRETRARETSTNKADNILTCLVLIGVILFMCGLSSLCLAINFRLVGTLGFSFGIATFLYSSAYGSLVKP